MSKKLIYKKPKVNVIGNTVLFLGEIKKDGLIQRYKI